ncbi:MAG: hypothetical protein Q8L92_11680, partial [Rubrivivax sp.]|nr:hypothetical protein [Rubrivivax sp.]
VVLGAGKTAMDTLIWLMASGADPAQLEWVVPRDSWLVNRVTTQAGLAFFKECIGSQVDQMAALATATSTEDLFLRLEACGALLRIDTQRMPSMFHLATMTPAEVAVLRRVQQVVRLGRVQAVHADHLQLEQGQVPVQPGSLFIDCTASAVEARPVRPIFQAGEIVLQMVRLPQPAFSAALTAYVEAHYEGDKEKNRLCGSVPFPQTLADYPKAMMVAMWNQFQWGQDKPLREWIRSSRLDGFGKLVSGIAPDDHEKRDIVARFKQQAAAAMANIPKLVAGG